MIENVNCVCTCGFDCEDHIGKNCVEPGDHFHCPKCGKELRVGLGDDAHEIEAGKFEVVEYLYTVEP